MTRTQNSGIHSALGDEDGHDELSRTTFRFLGCVTAYPLRRGTGGMQTETGEARGAFKCSSF